MPLSASVSSRGLLLCLYGRALFNGRFSRVCESPCKNTFWTATAFVTRDTFDAFLSYRAGIYPDLETESRCFRYLFYIECGIDTREKLAFWQNFVNLSSICSFFLNVYRFPSKTPPRLKFLPFHPIYFQYIYIYRIPRWKNFKLSVEYVHYSSTSFFFPICILSRVITRRENSGAENISLSKLWRNLSEYLPR